MSFAESPPADQDDLEIFRRSVSRFLADEMRPRAEGWRRNRIIDRASWTAMAEMGLLGVGLPETWGGSGGDIRHEAILLEEVEKFVPEMGPSLAVHSHIVAHYFLTFGTEAQKARYLPKLTSGEFIGAIAMTEPGTGSDLRAIRTAATRSGNGWQISGQKTFISNGINADVVITACQTDAGLSLMLVETEGTRGYSRGRHLEKIGHDASDTSELFFDAVEVGPDAVLGGEEGRGLSQLMAQLPRERLSIAISAVAALRKALELTISYTSDRQAFGKPLIDNQHVAFELADLKTEVFVAEAMLARCIDLAARGQLDTVTASMAKYWSTEKLGSLLDRCLQLHGGNGFMKEFEIARMYVDARVLRIYGGTSEIMRMIIARSLR